MSVAEARGVIQYICKECGLEVFEYHPNAIKIAITGHGGAKKEDIAFMIPKLISYDGTKKLDDELDAIAVAITHLANGRNTYPQLYKQHLPRACAIKYILLQRISLLEKQVFN